MKTRRKARGILDGTVALSNKGCPRYYPKDGVDRSAPRESGSSLDSKPCGCPAGTCWYDAQLARRAQCLPALTPEEWRRRLVEEARRRLGLTESAPKG